MTQNVFKLICLTHQLYYSRAVANLSFYLPQFGVYRPPKGLDQRLKIHYENSLYFDCFDISEDSQFPVTAP